MLILARRVGETILIGDGIEVIVCSIHKSKVLLGIVAPRDVPIHRGEVRDWVAKDLLVAGGCDERQND